MTGGEEPRFTPKEARENHVSRLRSVLVREGNTITLTDLDAAVYLHAIKRLPIHAARKVSRSMHLIDILDEGRDADQFVIDFVNSESARFADGMRRVKKILHRFGGNGRRQP